MSWQCLDRRLSCGDNNPLNVDGIAAILESKPEGPSIFRWHRIVQNCSKQACGAVGSSVEVSTT